jgi:hypothetical protein
LTPGDPQTVPVLLKAAEEARTQFGYSDTNRRPVGHVDGADCWILCTVSPFNSSSHPKADESPNTVQIQLAAPYLEP